MENQDRIKALEDRIEALSRDLANYQNTVSQLRNPVENTAVIPPIVENSRPKVPPTTILPSKGINSEEFWGGNLLSKIGIFILVIGLGIFVKYAIDNNLLNPAARIVLGYVAGSILAGLAYYLKPKYHTYSSVLVSGAVATTYFTTYSAYHFYQFYPLWLTFGLMVLFTVLTVYLATIYDRQWIGIFGLVGAYAIPFLLSDNSGQVWKLFTYIALVNVGILWLLFRKKWLWMGGVAFSFTWLIFIFASESNYQNLANIKINTLFSIVFFVLAQIYFIARTLKQETIKIGGIFFLVFNYLLYYFSGLDALGSIQNGRFEGLFSLIFGLLNLGLALYLLKKSSSDSVLFWSSVIATILLLYTAGFLQINYWYETNIPKGELNVSIHNAFKGIWILNYTMAFLSGLILLVRRYNIKHDSLMILTILSGFVIWGVLVSQDSTMLRAEYMKSNLPFIGLAIRYLQYILIAILVYFNLQLSEAFSDSLQIIKKVRYLFIHIVILLVLTYETTTIWMLADAKNAATQADDSTRIGYSVLWAIYGLLMIYLGFRNRSKLFRISGIVLLGIVIIKLFTYDLSDATTITKIILFISVGILLLIASFLYQRLSKKFEE
ncbi:MAG: DUF2339 domain-containing protein [Spirosomaceae bacterium]|nr:DUF2339 domain-containing protein [Spirosomataceae bacterium]